MYKVYQIPKENKNQVFFHNKYIHSGQGLHTDMYNYRNWKILLHNELFLVKLKIRNVIQ